VVEDKDSQPLKTLTTGLPSPTSLSWSTLTFLINLALVLMTADLVYRGAVFYPANDLSMARVGYVSPHDARLLVREADAKQYPIVASYRGVDPPMTRDMLPAETKWKSSGQIDWLDERTDFTGTFTLTGLKPDMRYHSSKSRPDLQPCRKCWNLHICPLLMSQEQLPLCALQASSEQSRSPALRPSGQGPQSAIHGLLGRLHIHRCSPQAWVDCRELQTGISPHVREP
jgi:hypothetical protein